MGQSFAARPVSRPARAARTQTALLAKARPARPGHASAHRDRAIPRGSVARHRFVSSHRCRATRGRVVLECAHPMEGPGFAHLEQPARRAFAPTTAKVASSASASPAGPRSPGAESRFIQKLDTTTAPKRRAVVVFTGSLGEALFRRRWRFLRQRGVLPHHHVRHDVARQQLHRLGIHRIDLQHEVLRAHVHQRLVVGNHLLRRPGHEGVRLRAAGGR